MKNEEMPWRWTSMDREEDKPADTSDGPAQRSTTEDVARGQGEHRGCLRMDKKNGHTSEGGRRGRVVIVVADQGGATTTKRAPSLREARWRPALNSRSTPS